MNTSESPAGSGKAARMAITQEMTIYHAEAIKDELMHSLERSDVIDLDLSLVTEIDTAGIQLLMLAKRECQQHGKMLNIVAHSPAVHELIDIYNIAGFFGDPLIIPARGAV